MNMTRSCPVPSCTDAVKPGHLLCLTCWRLVPIAIQKRVHSTWRALKRAAAGTRERRLFTLPAYQRACQEAIDAAERERGLAAPAGVATGAAS